MTWSYLIASGLGNAGEHWEFGFGGSIPVSAMPRIKLSAH